LLQRLDGLAVGENAAEGVIREGTFLHPGLDFRVRFPDGWRVQNGKTAVGAVTREGDAMIVLEAQEKGSDPQRAASRFLERNALRIVDHEPFRGAESQGYRVVGVADTDRGTVALHLAFLPHEEIVYRMTGVSSPETFRAREGTFLACARSLRSLTRDEQASIGQRRLRLVRAQSGESIADLSRRSGNAWSLDETAVANGLDARERLEAGRLVKIAREEALGAGREAPVE
jgi:predicted Zn-dependent protease